MRISICRTNRKVLPRWIRCSEHKAGAALESFPQHNLHKLEAVAEAEVTGIMPLTDKKIILAVGWSRQITTYDDGDPDVRYSILRL